LIIHKYFEVLIFNIIQNKNIQNKKDLVNQLKFETLTKIFDIENITNQYPNFLSGGQKQRVAIIRALMINPKFLIL
jgi:ABC-type methionine transport system ATPase subunit